MSRHEHSIVTSESIARGDPKDKCKISCSVGSVRVVLMIVIAFLLILAFVIYSKIRAPNELALSYDKEVKVSRPIISEDSAVFLQFYDSFGVITFSVKPFEVRMRIFDASGQMLNESLCPTGRQVYLEGRKTTLLLGEDQMLYLRFSDDWVGVGIFTETREVGNALSNLRGLPYQPLWETNANKRMAQKLVREGVEMVQEY